MVEWLVESNHLSHRKASTVALDCYNGLQHLFMILSCGISFVEMFYIWRENSMERLVFQISS